MALSTVLCGANNWVGVADRASDHEVWLRNYLALAFVASDRAGAMTRAVMNPPCGSVVD